MHFLDRWWPLRQRTPQPTGAHAQLTVGLVADELTRSCLVHECRVIDLTPSNFDAVLRKRRPDMVFVESAWQGHRKTWKFGIAAYPDHPERNNAQLRRLVERTRDLGIPAVFWNKEDGIHFDRFLESARLFDTVFTVDAACVPRYREALGPQAHVDVLPFAVQPAIHGFHGIGERRRAACFVGTYDRNIHPARRVRQDMLLRSAASTLGLVAVDRNSDRRGANYRYPDWPGLRVAPKVPHWKTGDFYRSYLVSLNVNTIEDSDTMFSRRLIEILGCGGLAVTTPARAIDHLFKGYCHVVRSSEEATDLFERLSHKGYDAADRAMMEGAAEYVLQRHSYAHRLATVRTALARHGLA